MARKKSPISVTVKESLTDGDQRLISIEVLVPQSQLFLSDTFARQGTLEPLSKLIKASTLGVVERYINAGGETLAEVSRLLKNRTTKQPSEESAQVLRPAVTGPEGNDEKDSSPVSSGEPEPVSSLPPTTAEAPVWAETAPNVGDRQPTYRRFAARAQDAVSALYTK